MSGLGRAFAQAQERYDNRMPPNHYDFDADNAQAPWDDATEAATEKLLSQGANVADTLAKICDPVIDGKAPGWDEVRVGELCQTSDSRRDDFDPMGHPPHVLLAVVMLGGPISAERALRYLREEVAMAMKQDIADEAEQMLKTHKEAA